MLALQHYSEFKTALQDYRLSDRAKNALEGLNLVLLVAPTSTGRNTVIAELLKSDKYHFIVSDTTRPPQLRDGRMEENGVQYFFRSEEDMLADIEAGEFLEAALIHEQQVSGISIRELENAKKHDKIAITDIEIVGADNVWRAKPDAKFLFLVPPSFDEWQRRIHGRGEISETEFKNRLISADKELVAALEHDYYQFVISENVEDTAQKIDQIASGYANQQENERAKDLVKAVHEQLKEKLASF